MQRSDVQKLQQRCGHKKQHQCAAAAPRGVGVATAAAAPRGQPATAMLRLLTLLALLRAAEAGITLEFGTKKKPPPQKAKAVEEEGGRKTTTAAAAAALSCPAAGS